MGRGDHAIRPQQPAELFEAGGGLTPEEHRVDRGEAVELRLEGRQLVDGPSPSSTTPRRRPSAVRRLAWRSIGSECSIPRSDAMRLSS
jgi:hypothetical protein